LLKNGKIVAAGKSEDVLTSKNIKTIFDIDTIVKQNPITKSLYVIPISTKHEAPSRNLSVHLICGAGTGSSLMKLLLDDGYSVTAGVLNLFDTDQETANFLKISVVSEAPLSPISDFAYESNLNLISKANAVILTSFPFGSGNIRNLDAANFALDRNIPTFVLNESPVEMRDFTKGEADKKMSHLKNKGAVFFDDQNKLFSALNNLVLKNSSASEPFTPVQTLKGA
jgi:iron complex transport system ATP-binding protein